MSDEIKQFVNDYIGQSNRATRWPYSYVIQELQHKPAFNGCGQEVIYCCHEHEYYNYKSEEELKESLIEDGYEKYNIESYEVDKYWEDKQWFFTEKAANEHLDRNGHNYKETRLYVKYFLRNREAEMILRNMFKMAGEDYDKYTR